MNLVIADDSGHISVTLWEEMAERFELIPSGLTIEILDGYVTERNGKREISIGEDNIPPAVSDIDVAYSVDCTPLEYLEENEVVDVSGEIIDIYDYDNNGKGLRIEDNSGTTIVSINQKSLATREYNEGDQILATNTESYESNGYINVRTQYKSLLSVY
jgi:replication factor A1